GLGRGGGGQLGGLAAGGLGGGLGGGRLGLGGAGGAIGGGGLFAGGGVLAGALLGGGAGALGLLAGGQFDGAAARLLFGGRQSAGVARGRGRTRRGGRLGLRTGDVEALRALVARAGADAALGLDHHGLGAAVAEALAHGAGRNRSRLPRLQAQRRARPRLGRSPGRGLLAVVGLVVLVSHPVALLGTAGDPPSSRPNTKSRAAPRSRSGSRTPPAQILVRVLSRPRAPLRGLKRSKSRQSF